MTIENNAVSRSPVYGVDRVTIWLDRPASEAEFEELREHCTFLTVTNDQPKFQANRKCKLELFQPTRKCLRMAKEILGAETNADLTYVELARDVTLPNRALTALLTAFLGSVKVSSQRSLFVQCEGTFYCGKRAVLISTQK